MPARTARPPSLMLDRVASEHPQIDPHNHTPNASPAVGTVGPHAGVGEVWHASPWAGWPAGWGTPPMGPGWEEWSGFGFGRQDPGGYGQRVSTVSTCIDLNTSQLASFPLYGVNEVTHDTELLPAWSDNPQPGVYANWSDFLMALGNELYATGEAFLWATERYSNLYPATFIVIPSAQVEILPDEFGRYQYVHDGDVLRRADVCHIRYQTLAGQLRGVSPLQWVGRHLVSASALERYATNIALHGTAALLKNPANLNSTQREDAKNAWMTARALNPAAPAVLSGQWEYEQLTLNPKDMALLDLKQFDEQHIAAAFRTPPFLVGVEQAGGSLVYQNVEALTDHHWRVGLRPTAKQIATAISGWALPRGHRMEFNRDEYIRPGPGERATYYAVMAGILDPETGLPAMTVEEIRLAERLLPTRPRGVPQLTGANP